MRWRPDPDDDEDKKELADLDAPAWMLELLHMNPDYPHWGPDEELMTTRGNGWSTSIAACKWEDHWPIDNLNECVHFYFEVSRPGHGCGACDRTGYNAATREINRTFFDHENAGRNAWGADITEDEAAALVASGRGCGCVAAAEFNRRQKSGGHDAINRWILVETRAKRLGVYGMCEACGGSGEIVTGPARASLVVWMLHPRKGASRSIRYVDLRQDQLPSVFAWLREAANRNAGRFARIPEPPTAPAAV